MKDHVVKTSQSAYLHLRRLRFIRKYLSRKDTEKLVHAFITSKLDFNNGLLYGITGSNIYVLQKVQHSAARLITGAKIRDSMTPVLRSLHWLPIRARIEFKVSLLVFKCLNGLAPAYLSELIKPVDNVGLRSSINCMLQVPKSRPTYGDRSFSVCGPRLWNSLPITVKTSTSLDGFKSQLKTHLFRLYF